MFVNIRVIYWYYLGSHKYFFFYRGLRGLVGEQDVNDTIYYFSVLGEEVLGGDGRAIGAIFARLFGI